MIYSGGFVLQQSFLDTAYQYFINEDVFSVAFKISNTVNFNAANIKGYTFRIETATCAALFGYSEN